MTSQSSSTTLCPRRGRCFRFAQMIANGGEFDGVRLLGRKTVDLMISNHTGEKDVCDPGPGYGFLGLRGVILPCSMISSGA